MLEADLTDHLDAVETAADRNRDVLGVPAHTKNIAFTISRRFHCVEVIGQVGFEHETSTSKSNVWNTNFSVQARLVGLEGPLVGDRNESLAAAGSEFFNDSHSR